MLVLWYERMHILTVCYYVYIAMDRFNLIVGVQLFVGSLIKEVLVSMCQWEHFFMFAAGIVVQLCD